MRKKTVVVTVLSSVMALPILVAQQLTTIPGPVQINGPTTIVDGNSALSAHADGNMFALQGASSPAGRALLWKSSAGLTSNLHYDSVQGQWVADDPTNYGVLAVAQGDNFEVWQLPPGASDLVQVLGVYKNGIGMYTRQPQYPVDIKGDVGIIGNLYVNGVAVKGCAQ